MDRKDPILKTQINFEPGRTSTLAALPWRSPSELKKRVAMPGGHVPVLSSCASRTIWWSTSGSGSDPRGRRSPVSFVFLRHGFISWEINVQIIFFLLVFWRSGREGRLNWKLSFCFFLAHTERVQSEMSVKKKNNHLITCGLKKNQ